LPPLEEPLFQNSPSFRAVESYLIEGYPAVHNLSPVGIRSSFPQIDKVCFISPFDKRPLAAIIDELLQKIRSAHREFPLL